MHFLDSVMTLLLVLAAYYTGQAGLYYSVSASKDGLEVYSSSPGPYYDKFVPTRYMCQKAF